MKNGFATYHPVVNFVYFALVLFCAMFFMNPIGLCISFCSATMYAILLHGKKLVLQRFFYLIPMVLLAILVNILFNHQGNTILWYFPSGNPLTLESICYAIASGTMLISVVLWFYSFHTIMTTDKFIYLFGRVIPSLSLVLSMTLRLLPKCKKQYQTIYEGQQMLGRTLTKASFISRIKLATTMMSILVTWALENGVETADSMKSRGYGLSGRTAFSIFRWEKRDRQMMMHLCCCGAYIFCGYVARVFEFHYYPTMQFSQFSVIHFTFQAVYFVLCATPLIIFYLEEGERWKIIMKKYFA